jgi:hypothetical protein
MEQPALQHHAASGAIEFTALSSASAPPPITSLYIALGLHAQDPGYAGVTETIESLGQSVSLHEGLWQLNTSSSIQDIFRQLNKSMLDRRIDGATGLLVLETLTATARWYMRRPISDVMSLLWSQRNDLFVSFTLHEDCVNYESIVQDMRALGTAIPIGRAVWYISSVYSSKEAFQILIGRMDRGDQLLVFDSAGNRATWHDGLGRVSLDVQPEEDSRPHRATIHSLNPAFSASRARSAEVL